MNSLQKAFNIRWMLFLCLHCQKVRKRGCLKNQFDLNCVSLCLPVRDTFLRHPLTQLKINM